MVIKHRHSAVILDDRGLRKLLHNGENRSTNQKSDENAESIPEASDSKQPCSLPALSKVGEIWNGVREIVYRETFIIGVDSFSLKLFSFVFFTYNFYYWVTIFYYPK